MLKNDKNNGPNISGYVNIGITEGTSGHAHSDADHDRKHYSDRGWHVLLRLVVNHSGMDSGVDVECGRYSDCRTIESQTSDCTFDKEKVISR